MPDLAKEHQKRISWPYRKPERTLSLRKRVSGTCWPLLGTGIGLPALTLWKNHSSTGL